MRSTSALLVTALSLGAVVIASSAGSASVSDTAAQRPDSAASIAAASQVPDDPVVDRPVEGAQSASGLLPLNVHLPSGPKWGTADSSGNGIWIAVLTRDNVTELRGPDLYVIHVSNEGRVVNRTKIAADVRRSAGVALDAADSRLAVGWAQSVAVLDERDGSVRYDRVPVPKLTTHPIFGELEGRIAAVSLGEGRELIGAVIGDNHLYVKSPTARWQHLPMPLFAIDGSQVSQNSHIAAVSGVTLDTPVNNDVGLKMASGIVGNLKRVNINIRRLCTDCRHNGGSLTFISDSGRAFHLAASGSITPVPGDTGANASAWVSNDDKLSYSISPAGVMTVNRLNLLDGPASSTSHALQTFIAASSSHTRGKKSTNVTNLAYIDPDISKMIYSGGAVYLLRDGGIAGISGGGDPYPALWVWRP